MLEDHAADFIETWSTGHGVYGEHGAEFICKVFSLLQRTCYPMKPATRQASSPRCKGTETNDYEQRATSRRRKLSVTMKILV